MVLENILGDNFLKKKEHYAISIGVLYSLVGFVTAYLLFKNTPAFVGVAAMLFTVMLVVPTAVKLFRIEEQEFKGTVGFYTQHKDVMDFFIYYFLGSFMILLLLALVVPDYVFSERQLYDIQATAVDRSIAGTLPPPPSLDEAREIFGLFQNNVYVMVIAFVISLFYGSGAMFLITLNASIFASALAGVVRNNLVEQSFVSIFSVLLCNVAIMFIHMVPEVAGYLLAAIAGGILSVGVIREKWKSGRFLAVVKDALKLLLVSVVFLLLAAILENQVSKQLFRQEMCGLNPTWIFVGFAMVLLAIIGIEVHRKLRVKKSKAARPRKGRKSKTL